MFKELKDPRYCDVTVGAGFRAYQCCRKISVTVDGKGYCTQHDPEKVKARNQQKNEHRQLVAALEKWELRRQLLERAVVALAKSWWGHPDPRAESQLFSATKALVVHENAKPTATEKPQTV